MSYTDEPTTVTPAQVRTLSRMACHPYYAPDGAVIVDHLGEARVMTMTDAREFTPHARVLVTGGELRTLLAEVTSNVDGQFEYHGEGDNFRPLGLSIPGATMAALVINRRCSDIIDGRPVTVLDWSQRKSAD